MSSSLNSSIGKEGEGNANDTTKEWPDATPGSRKKKPENKQSSTTLSGAEEFKVMQQIASSLAKMDGKMETGQHMVIGGHHELDEYDLHAKLMATRARLMHIDDAREFFKECEQKSLEMLGRTRDRKQS